MNRHHLVICILVVTSLLFACDRDDDIPEVTFGQPTADEEPTGEEPTGEIEPAPTDDPSEASEGDIDDLDPDDADHRRVAAPGQQTADQHIADLPPGTADQSSKLLEGRKAFLNDRYEEAADVFEQLAFDEPITADTISAAVALGQIHIETGRPEEALELFDRLEDHVREVPEVLLVLARTYEQLDEPRRAVNAYERAFEAKPDYIFILPEMAEILVREGKKERAGEVLVDYEAYVVELSEHLEDPDETTVEERVYIADVFALLSDERAHEALEQALDDPSERVRTQAAIALGEGAAFDARDVLEEVATEDESESVRQAARQALETLRRFEEQFDEVTGQ